MNPRLEADEVARLLAPLTRWAGDVDVLERSYVFPDFPTAIRAVDEIAVIAQEIDHHPDIDIRWRTVRLVLSTHDSGGVTQLDFDFAHRIDKIASALGAT